MKGKNKKKSINKKVKKVRKVIEVRKVREVERELIADNGNKCIRCKYSLDSGNRNNICSTCLFELYTLSVLNLNEHI